MKCAIFLEWRTHRLLLLIFTISILLAGLFYNTYISRINSQILIQVQERAFPLMEKSNLLKMKLTQLAERFRVAAYAIDPSEALNLDQKSEALIRLLAQVKALVDDPKIVNSVQFSFKEYFQQGISIIQNPEFKEGIGPNHPVLLELYVKDRRVAIAIDNLDDESRTQFQDTLNQAKKNSGRILMIGFFTSIGGILIGGILSYNILLNKRLSQKSELLEGEVMKITKEVESIVSSMSHDLKAPVVSMAGLASMVRKKYASALDKKGEHYLDRIVSNAHYMEELIQGILTLAKIGSQRDNSVKVEVVTVLHEVLEILGDDLARQNIEIVIQPALPQLEHDRLELTQVFQNLIANAAKFIGNRTHPRIEIGGRKIKNWVEFYVKDNGIGIDPAYHEKVFRIFQRLKEVEVEGTGVGLPIVKKIMDLAGGKTWVQSRKNEGATFFVRFPTASSKGFFVVSSN